MKYTKNDYLHVDLKHLLNYLNDTYSFDFLCLKTLTPLTNDNNIFLAHRINELRTRMLLIKDIFNVAIEAKNTCGSRLIFNADGSKLKISSIFPLNSSFN